MIADRLHLVLRINLSALPAFPWEIGGLAGGAAGAGWKLAFICGQILRGFIWVCCCCVYIQSGWEGCILPFFVKPGIWIWEFLLPQATNSQTEICFCDAVRLNNMFATSIVGIKYCWLIMVIDSACISYVFGFWSQTEMLTTLPAFRNV